jgi:predicted branched-subunit amino acid permease
LKAIRSLILVAILCFDAWVVNSVVKSGNGAFTPLEILGLVVGFVVTVAYVLLVGRVQRKPSDED